MPQAILPRAAAERFANLLANFPVVVVTGARQMGKSTLVQSHPALDRHLRVTLDDATTRAEAAAEPELFVARAPAMVMDEVQRAPRLARDAVELPRVRATAVARTVSAPRCREG